MAKQSIHPRRYEKGVHPVYDELFNKFSVRSTIINKGRRDLDKNNTKDLESIPGIEACLDEQTLILGYNHKVSGDVVTLGNGTMKVEQDSLQSRLFETDQKINAFKERQKQNGIPEEFAQVPPEWIETKFSLEAAIDVKRKEIEHLRKALSALESVKDQERSKRVLIRGPQGSRWGEPAREIDHQQLGMINGVNCIVDKLSKYNGMAVHDYFIHVVKPWLNGDTKPEICKDAPLMDVDKNLLPAWPEGVKNHLKQAENVESESAK